MSTDYYNLETPITYLKLEDANDGHDRLSVWVNHALAGVLTLTKRETRDVIRLFYTPFSPPLHSHWGGKEVGAIITIDDPTLPDEAIVISEYDELLTVAQVKARHGAKRSDGLPTELLGYKDLA